MKKLEAKKAKLLADVEMPVEGLSIDSGGITFKGIPLAQVNTANKFKIAIAIAMKLNPTLKVIRMSGNDLDEKNLKVISEMVDVAGYQVWIEKISNDKTVGIYIEDGEIKQA